jgi:hypothetical protein
VSPQELFELAEQLDALRETADLQPAEAAFLEELETLEAQVGGDLRREAARQYQ